MSVRKKVSRRSVLTAKCPHGEMSLRRSVRTAKCPYGEVSVRRKVGSRKRMGISTEMADSLQVSNNQFRTAITTTAIEKDEEEQTSTFAPMGQNILVTLVPNNSSHIKPTKDKATCRPR